MTIIKFEKKDRGNDLNALLKMAVNLNGRLQDLQKKNSGCPNLENLFQSKIMNILIKGQLVDTDQILCGLYVAKVLNALASKVPESWYAVDYLLNNKRSGSPLLLKEGANTCFILCSLFPARANRRSMTISYYRRIGISLYIRFFHQTGKEIGFHMANNFEPMAWVAKKCVNEI